MTTKMMERIEALGTECAESAIEAGGPTPVDVDGECILPREPVGGDWDALAELLGRGPTEEEEVVFARAYAARMDEREDSDGE